MENPLKIRLAARCEAAGRSENEDNFQVAEDLSVSNSGFSTDKIISLGNKGALLLVCDGMGGMNAGEVASAIGVETIKNLFSPSLLNSEVFQSDETISAYIKQAIVKADARIKEEAGKDSAKQGMGSTAVLAWLLGNKVYVGWCGDSRAYRFNPNYGLEQLSHDHSYVQDLVDTGKLDPSLAFDHPQKNIITRSLGDPRGAARPDVKVYDLRPGDIVMLCSDGLSDSLRDEEIARAMQRGTHSMAACRDALWEDSRIAGWHDNVTIVIGQVVDENASKGSSSNKNDEMKQITSKTVATKSIKIDSSLIKKICIALSVILILVLSYILYPKENYKKNYDNLVENILNKEENYFVKDGDFTIKYETVKKEYQKILALENSHEELKKEKKSIKVYDKISQCLDYLVVTEMKTKKEVKQLKEDLKK